MPAVSFDNDGAPEVVVSGKTGILVRLGDIEGLADAVTRLAADRNLREALGRNGREWCLEAFDWHSMVEQIERLYTTGLGSVA